jgi:hypothetical protein
LNGNQCAFIEPLEATATGLYHYIAKVGFDHFINNIDIPQCIHLLHKEVNSIANFVLYHYTTGSKFNSQFWNHVKTLPFTSIDKPDEGKMYGQWGQKSFNVWEANT